MQRLHPHQELRGWKLLSGVGGSLGTLWGQEKSSLGGCSQSLLHRAHEEPITSGACDGRRGLCLPGPLLNTPRAWPLVDLTKEQGENARDTPVNVGHLSHPQLSGASQSHESQVTLRPGSRQPG